MTSMPASAQQPGDLGRVHLGAAGLDVGQVAPGQHVDSPEPGRAGQLRQLAQLGDRRRIRRTGEGMPAPSAAVDGMVGAVGVAGDHRGVAAGALGSPCVGLPAASLDSSWYSSSTFTLQTSWCEPVAMFSAVSIAVYIEWSWLL